MSLPVHMMLSVLLSGADCAEPMANDIAGRQRYYDRIQRNPEFKKRSRLVRFYSFFKTKDIIKEYHYQINKGYYP